MSDEQRDLYNNYDPFQVNYQYGNFGYDPGSYMSFTDCLRGSTSDYNSLSRAFGLSPSSSEVFSPVDGNSKPAFDSVEVGGPASDSNNNPETPNSSISSSSTEAGAEEDSSKSKREAQAKDGDEGGDKKQNNKSKKKGEKRQKEPRFAFMTKSEVDHLEDGYRWRKYGQKAVKNSPYPRSYYRCTTQKCTVKKRVERSFQDPSIVITTYEGQHNHPLPATLRGNSAAGMFASSSMLNPNSVTAGLGPSFPHELLLQMQTPNMGHPGSGGGSASSMYPQTLTSPHHQQQRYERQFPDYGLLQDMVPSMYFKQEP